jgi:hypothetical protein
MWPQDLPAKQFDRIRDLLGQVVALGHRNPMLVAAGTHVERSRDDVSQVVASHYTKVRDVGFGRVFHAATL